MHRLLCLIALVAALAAGAGAQTLDFVRFLKAPGTPAGSGMELLPTPSAVAAGSDGSTYVVGNVRSASLPVTGNVVQPEWAGAPLCGGPRNFFPCADAFAARISSDGRILFATYLGGRGDDFAHDVTVDSEGNAYVSGFTIEGMPFLEGSGAFVLKLSPDGSQVLWATALAVGEAIALAPGGSVVVAGRGPQDPTPLGAPEAAPLFRTGDEQIWKPVNRSLPPSDVTDLAIVSEGRMFAVARGLFLSDDFGDTWRELPLGLPADVGRGELPLSVAVQPENPSLVLVGTVGQGVVRSQDGGTTWTDSSTGLPLEIQMSIHRLAFAPSDPNRAYLAGQAGQEFAFFRSSDAGANWTRLSDPNREGFVNQDIGALVVDPSNPDRLYLSLQGRQFGEGPAATASAVFRSDDAGATWTLPRYGLEAIGPLTIDQSDSEILYAGTHLGFEISRDGGLTWTVSNPDQLDPSQLSPTVGTAVTAIARDPSDGTIFAASPSGVFRTANRGQTWRRLSARSARSFDLLAVAPRPGQPRFVFAALRQSTHGQANVSKLSPDGQFLEWSVSFGGSNDDRISDLIVASDGAVWITGTTESIDFPVVNAVQSRYPGGGSSAFLSKLAPDGSTVVFSTFLGGERVDQGASLALEASGAVVVAGTTFSPDFPTVFGEQRALAGESDAFLARLRSDASAFDFATYAGGPDLDRGLAVAIDSNGRLILAGETEPVGLGSGEIPSNSTPGDITVTRFNSSGRSELQLRLGGGSFDFLNGGLTIDANDRVLLGGFTNSETFGIISTAGGVATPGNSAFVAALDLDREGATPEITSVENGASFLEGPIAPGEILTIRGRNLGPRGGVLYAADAQGGLAADLSGVRVWIGGLAATPLYVQAGQINVVAPYGIEAGSSTEIVVETAVGRSDPTQREVVEAVPGLFTLDATGSGPAAALDEMLRRISPTNPAAPSGYVVLYATGLGRTDAVLPDGLLTPLEFPIPAPTLPVEVEIGGLPAHIDWIGAAPTLPGGIVQINARLSDQLLPGDEHSVRLIVAGRHSQDGVTLAVH